MSVSKADVRSLCTYLKECWTKDQVADVKIIQKFQKKQNLGYSITLDDAPTKVVGWEFPNKLTSYHRREIHTIANELKIIHCSRGDSRLHTRHIALYCSNAMMEEGSSEGEKMTIASSKSKSSKTDSKYENEVVQRAVDKEMRRFAAVQQEQAALAKKRKKNGESSSSTTMKIAFSKEETKKQLEEATKNVMSCLRTTLKSIQLLEGKEASAARAHYTQMIQRLSGEVETTTEEEEGEGEEEDGPTTVSNSDTSEEEDDSSSEEESDDDDDDDDDTVIGRRKNVTGFIFSDSEEDEESGEESGEGENAEQVAAMNIAPTTKTTTKQNKKQQKKKQKQKDQQKQPNTFDEADFLKKAAEIAQKEAARQAMEQQSVSKQETAVKAPKSKNQQKIKLPPKKSERTMEQQQQSKKLNSISSKPVLSEEEARRFAVMAAVAAAKLEAQELRVSEGETAAARKATIEDILGAGARAGPDRLNNAMDGPDVADFRKQGEYGAKKFIKPWRTGTKSQQQIAPKGHNKGFRGKTSATASKK